LSYRQQTWKRLTNMKPHQTKKRTSGICFQLSVLLTLFLASSINNGVSASLSGGDPDTTTTVNVIHRTGLNQETRLNQELQRENIDNLNDGTPRYKGILKGKQSISEINITIATVNPLSGIKNVDERLIILPPSTHAKSKKGVAAVASESIDAVMEKYEPAIHLLYQKFAAKNLNLRGKVSVSIEFDGDGVVRTVALLENTTKNQKFAESLSEKIRRWRMPKSKNKNDIITVRHTFVFT